MPVGELAVGMSPLSRRAMQIALSAPPSTGHLSAAHVMIRMEKSWMASPTDRTKAHGPGTGGVVVRGRAADAGVAASRR